MNYLGRVFLSLATILIANNGFSQLFGGQKIITALPNNAHSVHTADLDGDGDMDVLSASTLDDNVACYMNLGNGYFGAQQIISNQMNAPGAVYTADLDGDGDMDVLAASHLDDKIAWFKNLGFGNFSAQQIISSQCDWAESVYAADLDGDGALDVLSASSYDDKIAWYKNLGSGNFGTQQIISTQADYPASVYAADLDGDGDMDVLSASANDHEIARYMNLGNGTFGSQQIISTQAYVAQDVHAADLDGDGDMDVLSASQNDHEIARHLNLGNGTFGPRQNITTQAFNAHTVNTGDLDGDGDMDVLSASSYDDKIAWYENLGAGNFGTQQIISTQTNGARDVCVADLDGDGDMDVLSASQFDDKIAWYENLSVAEGCIDPVACNYDPDASMDNGSCCYGNCGCTMATACNYNSAATCDNGSCTFATTWYLDADGDTFYSIFQSACTSPGIGWSNSAASGPGDCNDNNPSVRPIMAENRCNNIDDDCDGLIDEGRVNGCNVATACNYNPAATCNDGSCTYATTWYLDADGDTYYSSTQNACASPGLGWSNSTGSGGGDCNDSNASARPGAIENVCNNIDDDCDGLVDEGRVNGCTNAAACNYNSAANCDNGTCAIVTTWYLDADGDTYYSATQSACTSPGTGWSISAGSGAGDCNDSNAAVRPGATENPCNNIDDDCDGLVDEARVNGCTNTTACNYNPAATCDNGSCTLAIAWYLDADGDTYYSTTQFACTSPGTGWSNSTGSGAGDCNDGNSAVRPGAIENVCNNIDDDCDGLVDEGRVNGCTIANACNYNPAANCNNGSCTYATTWYLDSDGDTYYSTTQSACTSPGAGWSNGTGSGGGDCNDSNTSVRPGATEVCGNGIDDDCDGSVDEGCCTLLASATTNYTSCDNNGTGTITANAENGTAPYTYSINGTTFTSNNTFTNLGIGVYTISVRDVTLCVATTTVTISPSTGPSAPAAISGPVGACRNQTAVVFTAAPVTGATSYLWTLPSGATGSSTTNSISLAFSSTYNTGNLCVRAVNGCGQSAQTCVSVLALLTVPSTPTAISGGNVNACSNTSKVYSITPVTNATSYLWTAPTNATITSGQGTTSVTVSFGSNFGSSGTIIVRAVNCKGNSGIRTLTVYNKPSIPGLISGTASPVCGGSTMTYSITAVNGATGYNWTVPSGATLNSGQGTTSISVTFPTVFTSGAVTVAATSACGSSSIRTLTVNSGLSAPASVTGQASNLCGGGSFTYTVPAVAGAISYNWTAPLGCSITANTGTSVTISIPSDFVSGNLCYSVTHACGTSAVRCNTLTAVPGMPAVISGASTVCANSNGNIFSTTQEGTHTYTWTVPSNCTITSGQGTNTVSINWGPASGFIYVKANNACGSSVYPRSRSITPVACMQSNVTSEGDNNTTSMIDVDALKIDVYPNPNTGQFVVTSEFDGDFVIHDELGRTVQTFRLSADNYRQMEINDLAAGMYFVIGRKDALVVTKKVAVVR
jgi:hypothetical protein